LNKKERIESVIYHKEIDRIPWTIYKSYPPWGEAELQFRNQGLAMVYQHFPIVLNFYDNVEIIEESKYITKKNSIKNIILRRFIAPLGEISIQHEFIINDLPSPGDLIQKFGSEIDLESLSWVTKYPIERDLDYKVLEYIYKNLIFKLNYKEFLLTEKIIGSEGIIMANLGKSPFQMLLYELMGAEKLFYELKDNFKKVENLFNIIYEKQREKYILAAKSPAKIIWCPENLTSMLTPPEYFKEFYLPFYNEMAGILHKEGKKYAVHMDGNLSSLSYILNKSNIDIIEGFTPFPMGDISLKEALSILDNKIIWINFPGTIISSCNKNIVEEYTKELLKSAIPGDRIILGCTETFPIDCWEISFSSISSILERFGSYPLKL
jgi:hypothetical protein